MRYRNRRYLLTVVTMPKVKPGEPQADFIKRCIPVVIADGTAKDGAQAAAICRSMFEQRKMTKDATPLTCPKCGTVCAYDDSLDAWRCPKCGWKSANAPAALSRYNSTTELPQSVKDDLGTGPALALYLDVYNREYAKSQNDVSAGVLAMDAVKATFARKGKGNWQRRTALSIASPAFPALPEIDFSAPEIVTARNRTWVDSAYRGSWVRDGEPLEITDAMLTDFVDSFRSGMLGTDPPVDINHLSMSGLPANALDTRAVGYIKDLKLATANTPVAAGKDGTIEYEQRMHLYSLVEWTDEGWQLVSTRKFRYISPAFDTNHEDQRTGENVGPLLLGIAVTNTPFLPGLAPILASRVKPAAQNLLAAKGATMQELVDLIKSLSLGFDALVAQFTTAGISKARELAAMCLLMAQGKVPPDAANAPVTAADLEAIGASNWAGELTAAGQTSVTIEGAADAEVATATAALKAAPPAKAAEPPKPGAAASATPPMTPPVAPAAVTSQTVEKSEKTTIEFTIAGDKPETVKLTREELSANVVELRRLRAEALESRIAALSAANANGYAFPPVVVDMARAFLTRKLDTAILLAKDVTAPDVNGAILRLLSEIRDRGLVKLTEQTNVQSQSGLKGKRIELLGYGPDDVPEERLSYYKRRDGAVITGRDVCVAELMSRYISGEEKMDSAAALSRAEREVAALES